METMNQLAQELTRLPVETRWLLRGVQLGMLMASEIQTAQQEAKPYVEETTSSLGRAVCDAADRRPVHP